LATTRYKQFRQIEFENIKRLIFRENRRPAEYGKTDAGQNAANQRLQRVNQSTHFCDKCRSCRDALLLNEMDAKQ
jgi:hypothetical protein